MRNFPTFTMRSLTSLILRSIVCLIHWHIDTLKAGQPFSTYTPRDTRFLAVRMLFVKVTTISLCSLLGYKPRAPLGVLYLIWSRPDFWQPHYRAYIALMSSIKYVSTLRFEWWLQNSASWFGCPSPCYGQRRTWTCSAETRAFQANQMWFKKWGEVEQEWAALSINPSPHSHTQSPSTRSACNYTNWFANQR